MPSCIALIDHPDPISINLIRGAAIYCDPSYLSRHCVIMQPVSLSWYHRSSLLRPTFPLLPHTRYLLLLVMADTDAARLARELREKAAADAEAERARQAEIIFHL
jgi:hypothetical protein